MSSPGKLPTHAGHANPYLVQNTNNGLQKNDLKYYPSFVIPGKTEGSILTVTNDSIERFIVTKKERLYILIPDLKRYEYVDCIVYYIFERKSSTGTSQNISFTLQRTLDTEIFAATNVLAHHIHEIGKKKRKEFFNNVRFKQTWSKITSFKLVNNENHMVLKLTDDASNEYILPLWSMLQDNIIQEIRHNLRVCFSMELNTDNTAP